MYYYTEEVQIRQGVDPETGNAGYAVIYLDAFNEKSIRRAFIRKVYSILFVQIAVTIGVMCPFLLVDEVKDYIKQNSWVFMLALAGSFVLIIALACCSSLRRQFPLNFILLAVFTICEGVFLGVVSSRYDTETVVMAAGITAGVTLFLTLFAFQTKWDFTTCNGVMFVALIILLIFGIFAIIFQNKILNLVYASFAAFLFSIYIVIDTQLMMGGRHQYALSPEEYIFAALNLYLDIINLFMSVLSIFGEVNS